MRTTMDAAGRIVIPKALRERVNLEPGPVEVISEGDSLRLSVPASGKLTPVGRFLVFDGPAEPLTAATIREQRLALQR